MVRNITLKVHLTIKRSGFTEHRNLEGFRVGLYICWIARLISDGLCHDHILRNPASTILILCRVPFWERLRVHSCKKNYIFQIVLQAFCRWEFQQFADLQNGYKALSSVRTFTGCLVISMHYNWNFGIELWYSEGGERRGWTKLLRKRIAEKIPVSYGDESYQG